MKRSFDVELFFIFFVPANPSVPRTAGLPVSLLIGRGYDALPTNLARLRCLVPTSLSTDLFIYPSIHLPIDLCMCDSLTIESFLLR